MRRQGDSTTAFPPKLEHADLASDTTWVSEKAPDAMTINGTTAVVTFDGSHYIILAMQRTSGIWRYVEP